MEDRHQMYFCRFHTFLPLASRKLHFLGSPLQLLQEGSFPPYLQLLLLRHTVPADLRVVRPRHPMGISHQQLQEQLPASPACTFPNPPVSIMAKDWPLLLSHPVPGESRQPTFTGPQTPPKYRPHIATSSQRTRCGKGERITPEERDLTYTTSAQ